jgi:hypothetical protein
MGVDSEALSSIFNLVGFFCFVLFLRLLYSCCLADITMLRRCLFLFVTDTSDEYKQVHLILQ